MTWLTNVPRGDLLPVDEKPRFQGNWSYIQTEMRLDHSWDEDADRDGHHKKMELPNLTDAIGAANVDANGDPNALDTAMTGYYYVRPKTATEAPDGEFSEPFYMMNDGTRNQFLQLGFRAMVQFEVGASPTFTVTVKYAHNITSVVRDNTGLFTITFAVPMPTNNYIPMGVAQRSSSNALVITPLTGVKTGAWAADGTTFKFATSSTSGGTARDPNTVAIAFIGG